MCFWAPRCYIRTDDLPAKQYLREGLAYLFDSNANPGSSCDIYSFWDVNTPLCPGRTNAGWPSYVTCQSSYNFVTGDTYAKLVGLSLSYCYAAPPFAPDVPDVVSMLTDLTSLELSGNNLQGACTTGWGSVRFRKAMWVRWGADAALGCGRVAGGVVAPDTRGNNLLNGWSVGSERHARKWCGFYFGSRLMSLGCVGRVGAALGGRA